MAVDKSAWEANFGSGVRGPYDFTILMARFTTDARYMNGEALVLVLSGLDEDESEAEEMLSVGADWESLDGGVTIQHPKGKASINRSTTYGQWCHFAAEACDKTGEEWIYTADPHNAATWVGTIWHLEEKQVGNAFKGRDGQEVAARFRLMPDSYLGRDGAASPVSAPPVASPPPAPSVAATAPTPTSPGDSRSLAAALARSSGDFATFIGVALSNDTISLDDVLIPELLDSSPTGFYATNHTN